MICSNIKNIQTEIVETCLQLNVDPAKIKLIAVSKTVDVGRIVEAINCGHFVFGENYIQESKEKIPELRKRFSNPKLEFHFIGHLQRNKAKDAVALFDYIHTVDKVELAQEVSKQAAKISKRQKILLQINISGEESKSGVNPDEISLIVKEIISDKSLELVGLMSIGSYFSFDESKEIRSSEFRRMSSIKFELENSFKISLPELSMGMSHDYRLAIEEGATMIRVGTAIFGERNK